MSRDFTPKPEDENRAEKFGMIQDEVQAGQPPARRGMDKQNVIKFVAFLGFAVLALGVLLYLKTGDKPEKIDPEQHLSVAKPVENSGVDSFEYNANPLLPPQTPAEVIPPPPAPGLSEEELAEIQKQKAMLEARQKSSVIVGGGQGGSGMAPSNASPDATGEAKGMPPELQAFYGAMGLNPKTPPDPQKDAATQGNRFGSGTVQAPIASASYNPSRTMLVQQGKVVDAVLETAIQSDIPSQIIARITEPVYGEQGRYPLLPAGTRLFGEYSSVVKPGQTRVAAVWRRAITPQGVEIMLDSPSTNNLGLVGMGGKVNNHFVRIFGTAALLSLLGGSSATIDVGRNDRQNSASAYRTEVANAFRDTAQSVIGRYADIPPTITVQHGSRIKVLIAKDLDFSTLMN